MPNYIPPHGLKALDEYAYKSGAYSWLDNRLNPFWAWCAELLPLWMAPNLVTLIGTGHLFMLYVFTVVYDPSLSGASPQWVNFVCAYCVWMYQTLDAVDGKQARRTGTSSPLGQLFDHGCDSLGASFMALSIASVTCQQTGVGTLAILAIIQVPFFASQWEEHWVHTMRTQFGNFGVTEGQYFEASLFLVNGIFGSGIWYTDLTTFLPSLLADQVLATIGPVQLRHAVIPVVGTFPFLLAMASMRGVFTKLASKVHFLKACGQLVPVVALELSLFGIVVFSDFSRFHAKYPLLAPSVFGLLFSHLINRIIIATVCKMQYPVFQLILVPVPVAVYLLVVLEGEMDRMLTLAIFGAVVLAQYIHFIVVVNAQICNHLGIKTFRIPTKQGATKKEN